MRQALPVLLALLLPAAVAAPAFGQVTTNDQSLDSLKPTQSAPAAATPKSSAHNRHTSHAAPAKTKTSPKATSKSAAKPATAAKPPPPLPTAPPANPVIAPPPFVMPAHKPPPPPPVPVKPDAKGTATPLPGGLTRVTFGPGSSDLNPTTVEAIRAIATAAIAHPAQVITIVAWCAGTNDDPSTPRRISLDRALAARAVLINAGIVSERIHAVAKGFTDVGDGPADRVDVTVK